MAISPKFIFFDFFQELRSKEVGIELDLTQYSLLLDSLLLIKIEEKTEEDLKEHINRLCKSLWLTKKRKYEQIFDLLFDKHWEAMSDYLKESTIKNIEKPVINTQPPPVEEVKDQNVKDEEKDSDEDTNSITKHNSNPIPTNVNGNNTAEFSSMAINLDIGETNDSDNLKDDFGLKNNQFSFSDAKHFPFSQRAAEYGWRKLKGKTTKSPTEKIDIKAIIKYKAEKKYIDKLIFDTESLGFQHIIWLSDHGGSMASFAQWDDQLFQLLKNIPNTGKKERYYFHDCPLQKDNENNTDFILFHDKIFTEPEYFSKIQKKCTKKTVFIIFSDGGAVRKKNDPNRVKTFFAFNKQLQRKTNRVIWFNPVLDFGDSPAAYIQYFINTFLPTNKEIKTAISNL